MILILILDNLYIYFTNNSKIKTAMLFVVNYFNKATLIVFDDNFISYKLREHKLSMRPRRRGKSFQISQVHRNESKDFHGPVNFLIKVLWLLPSSFLRLALCKEGSIPSYIESASGVYIGIIFTQ